MQKVTQELFAKRTGMCRNIPEDAPTLGVTGGGAW